MFTLCFGFGNNQKPTMLLGQFRDGFHFYGNRVYQELAERSSRLFPSLWGLRLVLCFIRWHKTCVDKESVPVLRRVSVLLVIPSNIASLIPALQMQH
jgi:hypothetical protein